MANQAGEFDGAFVGPDAELFNPAGTIRIGRHYGGPSWEAIDGRKVVGALKARSEPRREMVTSRVHCPEPRT